MKTKLASLPIFILLLIEFLERCSYYGVRAVLVLYAVDESGLNMDQAKAYAYYGWIMALMGIAPFFMGLLTDFVFKQRKAVLIGGGLALIGYLMLLSTSSSVFFLGATLSILGTSLVRPNLIVLLGRLYDRADRRRNMGFLLFLLVTSLGGGAVAGLGYIGEVEGWVYSFMLAAVLTIVYLLLFLLIKNRMVFKELEASPTSLAEGSRHDAILDAPMDLQATKAPQRRRSAFPLILVLLLYAVVFWESYSIANGDFIGFLATEASDVYSRGTIYLMSTYFLLGSLLVILIIWWIKGSGSSLRNLAYASFGLAICSGLTHYIAVYVPVESIFPLVYLPYAIFGIAEVLCSAIIFSYLTRLSNVRYSSTTIGLYFLVISMGSTGMGLLPDTLDFDTLLLICTLVMLSFGIFFLVFKSTLLRWADGLD